MKNVEVLSAFINGLVKPKTKNLHIDGGRLYNYQTCIAERVFIDKDGVELYNYNAPLNGDTVEGEYHFVVNVSKYSTSTTTIQNQLLKLIPNSDRTLKCVAEIPVGAKRLG